MNKSIILIGIILVSISICGCVDRDKYKVTYDVDIEYVVRDVHIGYVNGVSVIVVEYYDENSIKIIDNRMDNMVTPRRHNIITIERSSTKESTLFHYQRANYKPYGKYILYLSDDMEIGGTGSNHPHSRRADEETFLG